MKNSVWLMKDIFVIPQLPYHPPQIKLNVPVAFLYFSSNTVNMLLRYNIVMTWISRNQHKVSLNGELLYFPFIIKKKFGVLRMATCIFFLFNHWMNQDWVKELIMALSPFPSRIGWDSNPRPSNSESSLLTTRPDFNPYPFIHLYFKSKYRRG